MNTLIIYDTNGTIFFRGQGAYVPPVGIPFMELSIPSGKHVDRVDVTDPLSHAPIYIDAPKSETQTLKEQVSLMQQALDELLLGGM